MRAMILCAGLSTRLGKLGSERPKPMLPVCGIPILAYGMLQKVFAGWVDARLRQQRQNNAAPEGES